MAQQGVVDPNLTSDDKLWSLLSWLLWPVAIVCLFMEDKKNRPFIKYNAVLSLAFTVVMYILGTITFGCLAVVGIVYMIYIAVMSYQGKWVEIPWLSNFVKKQGWV